MLINYWTIKLLKSNFTSCPFFLNKEALLKTKNSTSFFLIVTLVNIDEDKRIETIRINILLHCFGVRCNNFCHQKRLLTCVKKGCFCCCWFVWLIFLVLKDKFSLSGIKFTRVITELLSSAQAASLPSVSNAEELERGEPSSSAKKVLKVNISLCSLLFIVSQNNNEPIQLRSNWFRIKKR